MTRNINRFMITGTGSGCGKTTITCAILKALKKRGMEVTSFKAGPDYIDPMFHSKVIGTKARNLDIFLSGEKSVKYLLAKGSENSDISVIEGVMGNYDGIGIKDDTYSSNHLARLTGTPQILVLETKGMSYSVLAMISGFLNFKQNNIKGVILNNTSEKMYEYLKPAIEENLPIRVYGYMPKIKGAVIESRHLGLITADEIDDINDKLDLLAETAEKTIDIDGLLELSKTYSSYVCSDALIDYIIPNAPTRIAIADDEAFCFKYEDNLQLLRIMGAEIIPFSPLNDEKLPENINAVIFPGGYPELYAEKLSQNKSLKIEIKEKIVAGLPTIAECGGFMYLQEAYKDKTGKIYEMVGAVKGESYMTEHLVRFGYVTMKAEKDNIICKAGERLNAHEFHYSDSDNCGSDFTAEKINGKNWPAVIADETKFIGYPHVHFWGNISCITNFYNNIKDKTF